MSVLPDVAAPAKAARTEKWWRRIRSGKLPADPAGPTSLVDPYRAPSLARKLLRLLLVARLTMVSYGLLVAGMLSYTLQSPFPLHQVAEVLLAVGALSWWAWVRLKRSASVTPLDYMVQLMGDIALMTYALALSGGDDNPFDTFYIVPFVLAAYALSWRRVVAVILFGLAGWVLIHIYKVPFPQFHESVDMLAHVMLAALVTYFAFAIARISRQHERSVARGRENALERRNSKGLQTVAAQAADAMSSPLATMAVLIHEVKEERLSPRDQREALETLAKQVQICKENISRLLVSVGQARGEAARGMSIDALLKSVCDECEVMDPRIAVSLELSGTAPAPLIAVERSLFDALVLLMRDCASAAPHTVTVGADWNQSHLTIRMAGGGSWPISQIHLSWLAPRDSRQHEGPSQDSLTLAATLIGRFGGAVTYRPGGDAKWLQVSLPLSRLR